MTEALPSNDPPLAPAPHRLKWVLIALLCLITLMVFWGALQADFVQWDDDMNIYGNLRIRGLSVENLQWMFTDVAHVRRYMPLAWLSWAVNYEWGRLNPVGYHLGNVLFHALSAALVFLLIRKLLWPEAIGPRNSQEEKQALWCSALGALLWALHPLRVEPVAWASGRIYCQAIFLLLLSLLGYLQFAGSVPDARRRRTFYWLSLVAFAASMLTYPLAMGYVAVLVVLDFYPLRRFRPGSTGWRDASARRIWLQKIPFVAVVALVFVMTLWARIHARGIWEQSVSLQEFGLLARVLQAFYIWDYYAWKPWVPTNLSPVYTTLVGFDTAHWRFWLSLANVLGLTVVLIWQRKRWPGVLALWICHLALLVPLLGLTEHPHFPNDRYSYLVNTLWSVLIASGLFKLWGDSKRRAFALSACLVTVIVLGTLSVRQTRVWRDGASLFQHMIAKLGNDPYRADIHWRLAIVLAAEGKFEEAVAHYRTTLSLSPDLATARFNLALTLSMMGKRDEAVTNLYQVLQLAPKAPAVHDKLGIILLEQGRVEEAIRHYREALRLEPAFVESLNNLAWTLATAPDARLRNGPEAVRLAERACALTRQQVPNLLGTLAAAYAETGRFKDAVEMARRASALALSQGNKELAATNDRLLTYYQSAQAYRLPPKAAK